MLRTGFRSFACAVSFLLPLTLAATAGAQSITDEGAVAPSGPPISIMQRYVPRNVAPTRDMSLLVGDTVASTAPAPVITVTQASGSSLTTGNARGFTAQLAENRAPVIVVSGGPAKAR